MYYFTFVILKCSKNNFDYFFFFRINLYRSLLYDFWNKNMDLSRPKRKRKGFKTNLTISKKSKRYRKQLCNDKTTETAFLSSSEDYDTQSDASETGYLVPQSVQKSYFYRENIKTVSKSKFFQFHAVFRKIRQFRMLAPPDGWHPSCGESWIMFMISMMFSWLRIGQFFWQIVSFPLGNLEQS